MIWVARRNRDGTLGLYGCDVTLVGDEYAETDIVEMLRLDGDGHVEPFEPVLSHREREWIIAEAEDAAWQLRAELYEGEL